jgi:hypothetical protein
VQLSNTCKRKFLGCARHVTETEINGNERRVYPRKTAGRGLSRFIDRDLSRRRDLREEEIEERNPRTRATRERDPRRFFRYGTAFPRSRTLSKAFHLAAEDNATFQDNARRLFISNRAQARRRMPAG